MYLALYAQFFKTSVSRLLIYRKNFIIHLLTTFMWIAYYIISIEVIFQHTDSIRGWTRGEVLLIVATLFLIEGLRVLLFYDNLMNLPEQVTEGNLDLVLTKPADAQFWLSLRRINFSEVNMIVVGVILWFYALDVGGVSLSIINTIVYFFLCGCGLLIAYSLWLVLVSLSFWYYRIDNISNLFNSLMDMGRYPMVIFKGTLRIIVFTIIPLGVITNFPVQALLGALQPVNLIYAVSLTGLLLVIARRFWLFAVRNYTSASS